MNATALQLSRNSHGRLCLTLPNGTVHEGLTPVRAFPIEAPEEAISLVGGDGKEVCWIAQLSEVPAAARQLLDEEFAVREFVPEVQRIEAIDAISVPSVWTVMTDKGPAQLGLKAEEDIRKLQGHHHLLITSRDGVQYRITDARKLDRQSQKFLELFL
ncbi:DUF1854 domain-containing protein [Comamonas jiangduensis]|uniref:cyanophycin metabolism-associated DUF1854 family protein n=1 Tax=Comamonas jiangduensis TaxID=1194168 RepID=UPI0024E0CC19|nr:DUF1854 domain-containing protein [Comamonas jiangduensis]